MKSLQIEPPKRRGQAQENVYYVLTLNPTERDHRILALLINYTSIQGECAFYKSGENRTRCSIVPEFTVLGGDCSGKCFIDGLTCPIILEYLEDQKSKSENVNG